MPRICKVLIVENDDYVREMLSEVFEEEGFLFATAGNGAEMERQLDSDDFDIVVIDVTQPGARDGGFALAETAERMGCAVILTTGDHRHSQRLEESGRFYLLKPFKVADLTTLANRILSLAAIECVRRTRSDGSHFPQRSG